MGQTIVKGEARALPVTKPTLSVVVTVVDGGEALIRCLGALANQRHAPPLEVIVPIDDTVTLPALDRFPAVTVVALGRVHTSSPPAGFRGQHELYDRRRAAGLSRASGDLIAILEDRGVPRPDWAAGFSRLHQQLPHGVIGGAIENGQDRRLNRAVHLCDFGRYERPFLDGPSPTASDVNVCYKRRAIESVRASWHDRFHEPIVHAALAASGETIFLSQEPVVDQCRGNLRLWPLCRERLAWGRLYGEIRMRGSGRLERALRLATIPFLPALLLYRLAAGRLVRRHALGPFLAATPAILVLLVAWSIGEGLGYLLSRAAPATPAAAA